MRKLLADDSAAIARATIPQDGAHASASLIAVVWQRRQLVGATVLGCIIVAMLYLLCAKKVYEATARVLIEQNAPKVYSENGGYLAQSESFMQSQADTFTSARVLNRALQAVDYRSMRTFAKVSGDPVSWVRDGGFNVDVGRKSDVLSVSMQSPYPQEAIAFINAVVQSYVAEQSQQKQSTGGEMLRVLLKEKGNLQAEHDRISKSILELTQRTGVLSFGTDRSNTHMERMAQLSDALTAAEGASMAIRAERDSIKDALATPEAMSAFALSQQFKGRDFGDREYDDLRSQLMQTVLSLSTSEVVLGRNNERVRLLRSGMENLKQQIANKERAIYEAQLTSLNTQLVAAEGKEKQLRAALTAQHDLALGLTPDAAKYAKLEGELARVERQAELLDGRIAEVNVNNVDAPPLNIQVLDPASVGDDPIKPKKSLVLAAAMMVGLVLGIGMAMFSEWKDARLRTPDEIHALLGVPVLALVPRINAKLSSVARGQLVHLDSRSPASEAYRQARTNLNLGTPSELHTVLVASPTGGDGKSTTASNLAIAFAQAGQRTLLMDCDLREPVQHLIFESDASIGLSSVIAGEEKLRDAVRPTRVPGLFLLPCGPVPSNPSEMLAGKRFGQLMKALIASFDRIVIDSPPLMSVADAQIMAASADATLLVLRMNRSARSLGALSIAGLEKVGANVVGAIANDVAPSRRYGYGYNGGSWQYAISANRLLAAVGVPSNGNGNGHELASVTQQQLPEELLGLDEPDWSAEPRA